MDQLSTLGIAVQTDGVTGGIKALDALAATGPKVEKAMAGAESAVAKTGRSIESLGKGAGGAGLDKVADSSRAATADVKKLGDATWDASESLASITRTGVAVFLGGQLAQSAGNATRAIYEASAAAERLRTMMDFATGGNGAREIEYLRQVTAQLGLEFASTSRAYGQFQAAAKGTALEGQKARDIFESVAKASAVMGLSTEQSSGALLALQQMISKGTVQAEELRGQLGERLPGAFQIAAKAMGVTTAELGKMLEQGQVVADDFLPKFARALEQNLGGAADRAADRLDAAVNRFNNAFERLKQSIGDAGVAKGTAAFANAATNDIVAMTEAIEAARASGSGLAMQLSAAAGSAIGRSVFGVAQESANLLNEAINKVSFGLTNLSTDVDIIPNVFKTSEARAKALGIELANAEKEFAALQARGDATSENFYLRNGYYALEKFIAKLREAKQEQDKLSGPKDPRDQSGYESRGQSYAAEAKRLEEVQAAMQKVLGGISGVKESFSKDLTALYKGYEAGLIKIDDYRKAVQKLINESGGGKATASIFKEASKELEDRKKLIAELSGVTADYQKDLTNLQAARKAGNISEERYVELVTALIAKQPQANKQIQEQAEKLRNSTKAQEEAAKAHAKYLAELERGGDEVAKQVQKLREEEEALTISAAKHISLAQALELVAIARLQEQQFAMMGAGNQAGIDAIQREIDKRRELIGLIASKEGREATKKAIDDTEREAERMARSIEQSITDSLMRGFESGKGFAETLKGTVEAMFKTMVLRPTIEAAAKQLSGGKADAIASWLPYFDAAASASAGKWGEAAGTALGAWLGKGAFGAVVGKTLGSAVDKIFSGGAGTPHMGAMYLSNGASGYVPGAGVVGDMAWGDSVYRNRSSQVEDYLKGVTTGSAAALNSIAKNFGNLGGFQVGGYFAADNRDASQGNIKILQGGTAVATTSGYYASNGEQGLKEYTSQLSAEVRKAIVGIGLPDWARGMLDAIGEAPALDQLAATVDAINATQKALGDLDAAFTPLGGIFSKVASLSGEATMSLAGFVGGLGGLDQLTRSYYDAFYTEGEKAAATTKMVSEALAGLGIGMPSTREAFRAIVDAQDLTTEAGRKNAAELLKLAPAFAQVTAETVDLTGAADASAKALAAAAERAAEAGRQALAGLAQDRGSLEVELLRAQGKAAAASALELQQTLARLTEGLNATDAAAVTASQAYNDSLRAQIEAATAASEAQRAAAEQANAVESQRYGIEGQLLQLQGNTAALRARELAALDPVNRALQERVFALQDEQAAATLAAQATQAAEQQAKAVADQRFGLEGQILQLQGDTAALRARELAALDPANRALQERINAIKDEQTAAQIAAQAAQELVRVQEQAAAAEAQKAQAIASQRSGLEGQLLQLQGNTAALRARELASLDASNRALQERIYALQDEQAAKVLADQAIAKASEEAAAKLKALADVMSNLGGTRFDLENQLLSLQGNGAEVLRRTRERDLAQLTKGLSAEDAVKVTAAYDLNASLRKQIEETTAAQKAAESLAQAQSQAAEEARKAAEQIKSAWQSVTDSIFDEVARIRGLITGDSGSSFADLQAQFAVKSAQAKAGDQEAAKMLPGLSQAILNLAEAQATSLIELQRIRAQTAASLSSTGGSLAAQFGLNVPRLATGTNYVPDDMLAVIHRGEAVVPAAFNPAAGGASVNAELVVEVKALRAELVELRKQTDAGNRNTARVAAAIEGDQKTPLLVEIA